MCVQGTPCPEGKGHAAGRLPHRVSDGRAQQPAMEHLRQQPGANPHFRGSVLHHWVNGRPIPYPASSGQPSVPHDSQPEYPSQRGGRRRGGSLWIRPTSKKCSKTSEDYTSRAPSWRSPPRPCPEGSSKFSSTSPRRSLPHLSPWGSFPLSITQCSSNTNKSCVCWASMTFSQSKQALATDLIRVQGQP